VTAGHDQRRLPAIRASLAGEVGLSLARDVVATMGNRVFLIAIGVVTSVIVARTLGPEGRGIYAVAVAITAISVQFGNVGLHASNSWAVARRPELLGALFANSLVASFALGGGIAIAILVILAIFPDLITLPAVILALSLIAIPINLAYLLLQNLMLGTRRIKFFNGMELLSRVLVVGILSAAVALGLVSVEIAVGASVAAVLVTTIFATVILARAAGPTVRPRTAILADSSRYGFRAYIAALFSFLLLRTDLLLVNYFRGAAEAGYYSIAVSLADLVYLLPVVIATMLFPRMAAQADPVARRALASAGILVTAAIMVFVVAAAGLSAQFGIQLLYGQDFDPSILAFLWLLPGIFALSIYTVIANFYAAIGFPVVAIAAPLVGLAVNVALDLILIPSMHLVGASVASSIAYCLMFAVIVVAFVTRRSGDQLHLPVAAL
jgi:O-antigen/teichoic acid export membrane protein